MLPVVEQEDPPRSLLQKEGQERGVLLLGIAGCTGQYHVVRPVVSGLALPRRYVVQGDIAGDGFDPAIGANRAMLGDQPLAMGVERTA